MLEDRPTCSCSDEPTPPAGAAGAPGNNYGPGGHTLTAIADWHTTTGFRYDDSSAHQSLGFDGLDSYQPQPIAHHGGGEPGGQPRHAQPGGQHGGQHGQHAGQPAGQLGGYGQLRLDFGPLLLMLLYYSLIANK